MIMLKAAEKVRGYGYLQQSASLLSFDAPDQCSSQNVQHREHVATAGPASMTGVGYEDSTAAAVPTTCRARAQGGPALDKLASACAATRRWARCIEWGGVLIS